MTDRDVTTRETNKERKEGQCQSVILTKHFHRPMSNARVTFVLSAQSVNHAFDMVVGPQAKRFTELRPTERGRARALNKISVDE